MITAEPCPIAAQTEALQQSPAPIDHFTGDATGLVVPAHVSALRRAGAEFLTQAFHAFGSLDHENSVTRITALEPCPGGSTGAKFYLAVDYAQPDPGLDTRLFVKFSRDFDDQRRDNPGRFEMAPEAPFMALSRLPGFPIAVPKAYFADYQRESGTGLIITQQVPYGEGAVEAHRAKCLDHETLDDPLVHYRAVVTSLARLCAAHKAGRLAGDVDRTFPFDPIAGSADPIRYSHAELQAELDYCGNFARQCPQMLPEEVRTPAFLAQMQRDAFRIKSHEAAIQCFLTSDPRMIALCHWNAHIDNCWFSRLPDGSLDCGFIDWGRVGQLTFGSILWGGLSAAHHDIWDFHLDELLALFASEYAAQGGALVTPAEIKLHLTLHMAAMGVARVLAFPEIITFRCPEIASLSGPRHPALLRIEPARNCRQVYVNLLQFWRRQDFGGAVEGVLKRTGARAIG